MKTATQRKRPGSAATDRGPSKQHIEIPEHYKNIPPELQALKQWVCWRYEERAGDPKPTKVPKNPRTGRNASTTDPTTWSSFHEAIAAAKRYELDGLGIGFVFTDNDLYCGVDLDHVLEDGAPPAWAASIVTQLNGYTEVSPSGQGLHIIVKAKLKSSRHKVGVIGN